MRQWGHAKDFCPPGLSFGSLQGLSCCAQWRRNNAFTSTSCPGKCHIALSICFPVLQPFQVWRTVRGVKNHFTWGKNTHSNWLSRWEWGNFLLLNIPQPALLIILNDRCCHLMGGNRIILLKQAEHWETVGKWYMQTKKQACANNQPSQYILFKNTHSCNKSHRWFKCQTDKQDLRWWLDNLSSWDSDTVSISLNSSSWPSFRGTSV